MEQVKESLRGLQEVLTSGKEYYEIRLESIGGLGANLCGKMLGELGVKYLGLNSSNFSSYGSEKTGTPVKGFIRYCRKEKEIRVHSPVTEPDLLVVFHQALLQDVSVLKGCKKDTSVIIGLELGQEKPEVFTGKNKDKNIEIQDLFCNIGAVYGLEAQKIAMETHSRINVVMLGAALKVMGIKNTEAGEQICKDALGKKYPNALQNNIDGIKRGYEEVRLISLHKECEEKRNVGRETLDSKTGSCICGMQLSNSGSKTDQSSWMEKNNGKQQEWGYDNMPIGGINPRFGSTVISDLSPSRQGYIPLFIKERCINCGLCFSACPDMVFQFKKGEYKGREMMINQGLDYYHCKGCLRCVDVCPVNALVRGIEAEHPNKEYFMPNQELLRTPDYYEEAGADGYITSESYLTEQRMDGGEV